MTKLFNFVQPLIYINMKKKDYLPFLVTLNKVPKGALFMHETDCKFHSQGNAPQLYKRGEFITALNKYDILTLDGAHVAYKNKDTLVAFDFSKIML